MNEVHLVVTLDQRTLNQLNRIESAIHQLEAQVMSTQEDIDAAVAQLGVDSAALNNAALRIEAEITNLEGQGVDTQPLKDALAALDTSVGQVGNIVPVPFVQKLEGETYVDAQTRLFIFNEGKPAEQQAPAPSEEEWNALPVG